MAKAPTKKTTSPAPARSTAAKATAKRTTSTATTEAAGESGESGAPAAAKKQGPFNEKFIEARYKQLLEERANLLGSAERLQAEAAQLMEDQDPGDVQFDDESGEGDSLAVERERDLALSAQAREMIAAIDAALERITEGTYGLSLISGKPIPKERLEAIPWATELVEEKVGGLGTPAVNLPPAAARSAASARRVAVLAPSLAVATLVVAVDQLTKAWALDRLAGGHDIDLFWTLRLHLTFNSGMAFGRGGGLGPVIGVVALVVVLVLLGSLRRSGGWLAVVAVGAVVGGAIGNIADRVFRSDDGFLQGAVIDFIDFQWWPVFNVADIGITVGGALLLVSATLGDRQVGRRSPPS